MTSRAGGQNKMGGKKRNSPKNSEKPRGPQNGHHKSANGPKMETKQAKTQEKPTQSQKREPSRVPASSSKSRLLVVILSVIAVGVAVVVMHEPTQMTVVNFYTTQIHPHVLQAADFLSGDAAAHRGWLGGGAGNQEDRDSGKQAMPASKENFEPPPSASAKESASMLSSQPQQQQQPVTDDIPLDKPSEKPVVQDIKVKTTPKASEEAKAGTDGKTSDASASPKPSTKVEPQEKKETSTSADAENKDIKPPKSPKDSYAKLAITNDDDYKIRKKLDEADSLLERGQYDEALQKFDSILSKHPKSPRAHAGKAEALDKLAEKKLSNQLLEQSIVVFTQLLTFNDIPKELMIKAGRRLADRQQFRGWAGQAVETMKFLATRYPEEVQLQRELGVNYLLARKVEEARQVFKKILENHPDDGFAQAHLGFIYITADNNAAKSIPLLQTGIESNAPGTQDGRFFFHLGSALQRQGRNEEAHKLYKRGAENGLFLSADQRSLYNVNSLTGRPWWTAQQTGYQKYLKLLEDNWHTIRDEGLAQLNSETGDFMPEEENLRETGDWKQLTMYAQGRKFTKTCAKVPKTCELIDQIEPAKNCRRGQVKFSVMNPGVHVWPHCGPTNCRIRAHLGLVVPEGPRIRVVNETRIWKEGKFIIFDDSFEHEVWHEGDSLRLVLIVDFWHPELSESLKRSLSPI